MIQKDKSIQIKYLQNEIVQLKLQIDDLKELNAINKQVIEYYTKRNPEANVFEKVVKTICEEMNHKNQKIDLLSKEKSETNAKVLVLEKMIQQVQENQRNSFEIIRQQIDGLKEYIERCELKIKQYQEKLGEVDYLSGFVTKFVNVSTPTQQSIRFGEEIKQLNRLIAHQNEALEKYKQEKENLIKINMALKSQIDRKLEDIERIKQNSVMQGDLSFARDKSFDQGSSGLNYTNYLQQSTQRSKQTSFSFLRFQRNIIQEESDSDFDPENLCPELSVMFPDKVEKIMKKRNQNSTLPRLNMQKVRTLMKRSRDKIDSQLKKNVHHNPTEKILTLETELQFTRRQLSKTILECKALSDQKIKNQAYIDEIQQRNAFLIKGYSKLKENWKRLSKQYFSYRKLYEECQAMLQSRNMTVKLEGYENGEIEEQPDDKMKKRFEMMSSELSELLKSLYKRDREVSIKRSKSASQ